MSIGSNSGNPADTCYANGQWQCSFEMHRVFIDEGADTAYLVSNMGSPGDLAAALEHRRSIFRYTAAGQPAKRTEGLQYRR